MNGNYDVLTKITRARFAPGFKIMLQVADDTVQLAKATHKAIEGFINPCGLGTKTSGGPRHLIPKEAWQLLPRHKAGETDLRYTTGSRQGQPFCPKDIFAKQLGWRHVHKMLTGPAKYYYTGGRDGRTFVAPLRNAFSAGISDSEPG